MRDERVRALPERNFCESASIGTLIKDEEREREKTTRDFATAEYLNDGGPSPFVPTTYIDARARPARLIGCYDVNFAARRCSTHGRTRRAPSVRNPLLSIDAVYPGYD